MDIKQVSRYQRGNLKGIQYNGKRKKGQTVKFETLHRKLKTEQQQ